MIDIKRSVANTFKKTLINGLLSYIILSAIFSLVMGIRVGWLIGLLPMAMGFIVVVFEYAAAYSRGLKHIVWNHSILELYYKNKVIKLDTNNIERIEQHYTVSSKFGFEYLAIFTFYQGTEKVTVDLWLFPKRKILINKIKQKIVILDSQEFNTVFQNNQVIENCEYSWGIIYKMIFDTTNHKIVFKNAFFTTTINLKQVKQLKLGELKKLPIRNEPTRCWIFEMKKQNKCKFLYDNFIATSQEKQEIRKAIVAICRMNKITINR